MSPKPEPSISLTSSSPSPARPKRVRSSPELLNRHIKKLPLTLSMAEKKSVLRDHSNFSLADLMDSMTNLLDSKLASVATKDDMDAKLASLATKDDIRCLREDYLALKEENRKMKDEVARLSSINEKNTKCLEEFDCRLRRNNVTLTGLSFNLTEDLVKTATDFFLQLLSVELNKDYLNVTSLGGVASKKQILLVSFVRTSDKLLVLRAARRLKNTGFSIQQDFPLSVRQKRSKLLLVRKEILRRKLDAKVFVSRDNLIVQGFKFEWSNVNGLLFENSDGIAKLSEILSLDLSNFVKAVLLNTLPPDHFSTNTGLSTAGTLSSTSRTSSNFKSTS